MANPVQPVLLTTEQAATYLNIPADTLAHWRFRGRGPAFVRVNKTNVRSGRVPARNVVRYEIAKLNLWIEAMTEVPA